MGGVILPIKSPSPENFIKIMTTETYMLSEGQFLAQLEPFKSKGLQTNSIIHKMVTGCGATTLELEFPRNSIIIEPNLPVILGKCKKLNKGKRKNKVVQGVYEGIEPEHIKRYLENRKGFKKILTTPEGFEKVAEALGDAMYKDYFLLFDECEKAIQDVDFRGKIINPIDAFFDFDNKAFVSATPLLPSDPRFKDFTHVIIKPDYDYSEKITVYQTNNVLFQLKIILDNYTKEGKDDGRKYFIFFKSTKLIHSTIKRLKLDDYTIFCSEDSVKELKRKGVNNAYDQIGNTFAKYNFLTSRFFSAVDIDYNQYKCDPIIIMLTNVFAVEHTVIDPTTEAVQICGRFRKPEKIKGEPEIIVKKDIYHISNFNSKLTSFNKNEIIAIIKDIRKVYQYITIQLKSNSDPEYISKFKKRILKVKGFEYFVQSGKTNLNYFMIDNFLYNETVKGYYQSSYSLIKRYRDVAHFKVDGASRYQKYILTDEQLSEIADENSYPAVNKFVSIRLQEIMSANLDKPYQEFNIDMLRFSYPRQMAIIDKYGLAKAGTLGYDIATIEKELNTTTKLNDILPMIEYINQTFEKKEYTSQEIRELLTDGINKTGLKNLKPTLNLLRKACKLSKRKNIRKDTNGNWLKGHKILEFLHPY